MRAKKIHWWSVLLLYPEYVSDGVETYYTHVLAVNREDAVASARAKMLKDNDWTNLEDGAIRDLSDLEEVLVLRGRHYGV